MKRHNKSQIDLPVVQGPAKLRRIKSLCKTTSFTENDGNTTKNNDLNWDCVSKRNEKKNLSIETSMKIQLSDTISWIDAVAPKEMADLTVHPKKIEEFQNWLKHYDTKKVNKTGYMLKVSGSSGCGKTTVIKVVANTMNYNIQEWINPMDINIDSYYNSNGHNENISINESHLELFSKFLFDSSRYKSLLEKPTNRKRLILVKDFPNIFHHDSETFYKIIEQYQIYGKVPLVFIVSEAKNSKSNLISNLFTESMIKKYNIGEINFNQISTTLMKKGLQRICKLLIESNVITNGNEYVLPSPDVIDSIILTSQGDMRNAINNLNLILLKDTSSMIRQMVQRDPTENSKKKKHSFGEYTALQKDDGILLMHALGRILYPKFNPVNNNLVYKPEDLAESFRTQPKLFLAFLHENYATHYNEIKKITVAIDAISIGDSLIAEYRDDALKVIGLGIGIRGIMVHNRQQNNSWSKIKGPKNVKHYAVSNEFNNSCMIHHRNRFRLELLTYIKIINNV